MRSICEQPQRAMAMISRILPLFALVVSLPAFADTYRQELGVGAIAVLNVKIAAGVAAVTDPALAPRSDRDYLDGFNRVDSSGNLGEGAPGLSSRTGNFGFISNTQVDLQRGTLAMHTLSPDGGNYFERSSRPSEVAPEVHYRIVRERAGAATFGLEARVGRIDFDDSSSDSVSGSVRVLTDTYPLGGVVPQTAPYSGTFAVQPGTQRIGDTPTRSIASTPATIQGERKFSAEGWLLRFGVVWEPVRTPRAILQVHGGPAAMNLKGRFNVNERWTATGLPALARAASGARHEWLAGGYAGVSGKVHWGRRWDLFAGADLFTADMLSVTNATGRAKFDFSRGLLVSAGALMRF